MAPNTGRTPDYRIKATTRPNVMPRRQFPAWAAWAAHEGVDVARLHAHVHGGTVQLPKEAT